MNFLAAAFLLSSLTPSALAQGDREVVRVNGTPIRQSEVLERLWRRFGPDTLEEMVDELLLRQEAQGKKITAEPADVEKRLGRLRAQFADPKAFENQLQQMGTSLDKIKQEIGEQLSREKLLAKERGLAVTEEDLKKAFEVHKERLGTPEAVHLRHILVKSEQEAKDLVSKIKGGSDFSGLAREKSLAPTGKLSGGDYGFVARGMLPPEVEQVAFAMSKDELKILPTERGFHILQAMAKRSAAPAEFDKVKGDLRDLLLQEKYRQALPDYLRELRQKAKIEPQGS